MNNKFAKYFLLIAIPLLIVLFPSKAQAKLLPRFTGSGGTPITRSSVVSSKNVVVTPRFLPGKSGLRVSFSGLSNANSVGYMLTYNTNGKEEGVTGSIDISSNSTQRDLLFSTCSSGVCTNHGKITGMKLEITSKLKSGKTSIRRYRIRV